MNNGGQIRKLHHLPGRIEDVRYEANRESGALHSVIQLADPLLSLDDRDEL
ncbi:MAG: hypothetical protein QF922_06190 [SAR324 cluster bacterium]|nr:hypothetical protein [SAR324 cluster bacterium]